MMPESSQRLCVCRDMSSTSLIGWTFNWISFLVRSHLARRFRGVNCRENEHKEIETSISGVVSMLDNEMISSFAVSSIVHGSRAARRAISLQLNMSSSRKEDHQIPTYALQEGGDLGYVIRRREE